MIKIALDAGHGLNTAGKRTPKFPDGSFMKEFEFNAKVAEYLAEELRKYKNVEIMFTHDHPSGKRDVPLKERTDKANRWKADLFVSLHANAYGDGKSFNSANGTSTFIHHIVPQRTIDIAQAIHRQLIRDLGRRNRGVKRANFHVLRETNMSAVLIEHAFMTNYEEAKLLRSDDFRRKCALATAKAIGSHYGLKKKTESKAKPTPKSDGALYRVQTGAFKNINNAKRLEDRLKKDGYSTYLIQDGLYKVQVGVFTVRSNADRLAAELRKKGYDAYIRSESTKKIIKVGSRVKIKQGAKSYDGVGLASFVYKNTYRVEQLKNNRAVLDTKGINTPVHVDDLILV